MKNKLKEMLYSYTDIETLQKESGSFIQDFPESSLKAKDKDFKLMSDNIFINKNIYLSKHNRFADYPLHYHQFLELNFVYSGKCTQIINGKKETLHKGDILLMDAESCHSIETLSKDDIMINILFRDKDIKLDLLEKISNTESFLLKFILSSSIETNSSSKYIIFRSSNTKEATDIINKIMEEYFFSNKFSNEIIISYLNILFFELIRSQEKGSSELVEDMKNKDILLNVLKEIDDNFSNTSLQTVANKLSYNKNYLSNLIKEKTGFTFTQLLNKQKLLKAKILIESSDLSISSIIEKVGFSNKNYFYKEYKKTYGILPTESRKHKSNNFI